MPDAPITLAEMIVEGECVARELTTCAALMERLGDPTDKMLRRCSVMEEIVRHLRREMEKM